MAFPGITNQVSDKTWGQADHKEGAGRTQKRIIKLYKNWLVFFLFKRKRAEGFLVIVGVFSFYGYNTVENLLPGSMY